MYGISWELSDRRDIGKIFAVLYSFSPCNSVWHVDDVDRLDKMYDDLENRIFSFQAAKELLHAVEDVISIAIKIYPDSEQRKIASLNTYQNFLNSSCVLAFFCYDCVYQEVYCKSEHSLLEIYHMIEKLPVKNLQWIECEDSIRTYF